VRCYLSSELNFAIQKLKKPSPYSPDDEPTRADLGPVPADGLAISVRLMYPRTCSLILEITPKLLSIDLALLVEITIDTWLRQLCIHKD